MGEVAPFAYVLFHGVIVGSLLLSRKLYPAMLVLSKAEVFRILPVSAFFIVWDFVVTGAWWEFNPEYILFPSLAAWMRLPIEEILFFLVVPYAVLTVVKNVLAFTEYARIGVSERVFMLLTVSLRLLLLGVAVVCFVKAQWYSFSVVVLLQLVEYSVLRVQGIALGLVFTVFTTLIFNMYLTALPVVVYGEGFMTGWRVGTIPVEDFGYGLVLYFLLVRKGFSKSTLQH